MRPLIFQRTVVTLYGSLIVFGIVCLTWTIAALPLYLVLPGGVGTKVGRIGIQRGFRLYAWWLDFVGAYRLDLKAIDALVGGGPVILSPNHPSIIDAILIVTRHPNLVCIMKSGITNNVLLGAGSRLAGYIRNEPPRRMVREAIGVLKAGAVLLLFPEATRTTQSPVNPFLASVGLIAKLAEVPVQTLLIETDSAYLGKGWPWLRITPIPITYRVRLGERFAPPDDVRAFDRMLEEYFRGALAGALQERWLGKPKRPAS